MDKAPKKHTMGRRKIEIKKIEKKSSLQVTFSKRRTGLFKKAGELSVLCGVDVAVLVRSPAGKVYAFGTPSADAVINRFLAAGSERLEAKNEREEGGLWWNAPIEELDSNQLERFLTSLVALRENVKKRADELAAARSAPPASVFPSGAAADPFGDLTMTEAPAGPVTTFGGLTAEEEGIFDLDFDFDFDDVNLL